MPQGRMLIRGTTLIISRWETPSDSDKSYPLTQEYGSHY